jgi:hypothetical protein
MKPPAKQRQKYYMRKITTLILTIAALFAASSQAKIQVLIKFDDLGAQDENWENHARAINTCLTNGLKCSDGIFAESLDGISQTTGLGKMVHDLRATNRENFELWLHGWYKEDTGYQRSGQTQHTGWIVQSNMFFNAQRVLVSQYSDTFTTWGPHYEGSDLDTGWLFMTDPIFKVWFRYAEWSLPTTTWRDTKDYRTALEPFIECGGGAALGDCPKVDLDICKYKKCASNEIKTNSQAFIDEWVAEVGTNTSGYLVIQGHPAAWLEDDDFATFEEICSFLKSMQLTNGIATRLPTEFAFSSDFPTNGAALATPERRPIGTANIHGSRLKGDNYVMLSWSPVCEDANSAVPCLGYVVRYDGNIIAFVNAETNALPVRYWGFYYHHDTQSYLEPGKQYTVQAVSRRGILGDVSTPYTLPAVGGVYGGYPYWSWKSPILVAFEGEYVTNYATLINDSTNNVNGVLCSLPNGLTGQSWKWIGETGNTTHVNLGPREHKQMWYRFYFTGDDVEDPIIKAQVSGGPALQASLDVRQYRLQQTLGAGPAWNVYETGSPGPYELQWQGNYLITFDGTKSPPIYDNAGYIDAWFSTTNWTGYPDDTVMRLISSVGPAGQTPNPPPIPGKYVVKVNGKPDSMGAVCNLPFMTNDVPSTNLVTLNAIQRGTHWVGNYGSIFEAGIASDRNGEDWTLDANQEGGACHFNLARGTNVIQLGFMKQYNTLGALEMWSLIRHIPPDKLVVRTQFQIGNDPNWTTWDSVDDEYMQYAKYYRQVPTPTNGTYYIEAQSASSVSGPWTTIRSTTTQATPPFNLQCVQVINP